VAEPDGWLKGPGCNCDIVPGDHVHVTSDAGFDATLDVLDIAGDVDLVHDTVSGTMSGGSFPASGYVEIYDPLGSGAGMAIAIAGNGAYMADFGGKYDLKLGVEATVWYIDANGNWIGAVFYTSEVIKVEIEVARSRIWGYAPEGPITITTATEVRQLAHGGGFDEWMNDLLLPGQTVTVTAGAGAQPVVIHIPDPFTAQASSSTDNVWGQVDSLDHEKVRVDSWGYDGQDVVTDSSGHYSATFPDIARDGGGSVNYGTVIDYAQVSFYRTYQTLDLVLRTNYGDNWVETAYEAGHTIWITVTDNAGAIKATATGTTGQMPWWKPGDTGFSTSVSGWSAGWVDIAPGDWVLGSLDNGYASEARIGTITGLVDAAANTIAGTVNVPWYTGPLRAHCEVQVPNGPNGIELTVDPGGGSYLCDFNTVGWDLKPSDNAVLVYHEPDGDQVMNVFRAPFAKANTAVDNLDGWFGAGATVSFTVTDHLGAPKGSGSAVGRADGWIDGTWAGCDVVPGDHVSVTSSLGFDALLVPITITGQMDMNADKL